MMIFIAYIIFVFSTLLLLVSITNLIFREQTTACNSYSKHKVSVLIPARNEEKNIALLLTDLIEQKYKDIEIIVFNDQSTDNTAQIITNFAKKDSRIKLINSSEIPHNWLGKNFACHSLSKYASGRHLLFLDADVRIHGDIIYEAVTFVQKYKLGLLSIFPSQRMKSLSEWLTVPIMNQILLSLLPLVLVRKSKFSSLAAANGQFMLFNANNYAETLPHQKFKDNKVEDIEIARFYKQNKIKTACLIGTSSIACRMYNNYEDALNGFSKNVVNFFGNSYLAAIIFWFITTFGLLVIGTTLGVKTTLIYIIIIGMRRVITSYLSNQNIINNLLLAIPQQFTLGIFIIKSIINKSKNQFEWKGRNIS